MYAHWTTPTNNLTVGGIENRIDAGFSTLAYSLNNSYTYVGLV